MCIGGLQQNIKMRKTITQNNGMKICSEGTLDKAV